MDFDLIVVGGGSGGVRAARMSASMGAKVLLVERTHLGGTCVNLGCVPKKLMTFAADTARALHDASALGFPTGNVPFHWSELRAKRDAEVERLRGIYDGVLNKAGVQVVAGEARFGGSAEHPNVEVSHAGTTVSYSAERYLIATGGRPRPLPVPGGELARSSDDFFALDAAPKSVVVVGGGYIGVELASLLRALGSKVHLVHREDMLLNAFDREVRAHFTDEFMRSGVDTHLSAVVERLEQKSDGRVAVHLRGREPLEADLVLSAIGRIPAVQALALATVGVDQGSQGFVVVDDSFRTSNPRIFAIGDCIGRMALTPVAIAEAMAFAEREYGQGQVRDPGYGLVPTAIFAHPQVATVGATEEDAWRTHSRVTIYKTSFKPMRSALSGSEARTFMKLVVDADTDRVLGVHMVGDHSAEILQGFAVALRAGATKADFDATIGIHPTAAEEFVTMRTSAS